MQDVVDPSTGNQKRLPKFIVFCNGAILVAVGIIAFISFWVFLIYLPLLTELGRQPAALLLFYPFPASLALLWGHRRVARQPVLSRLFQKFWPIATAHYIALAVAFLLFGFTAEKVPVNQPPQPEHGIEIFFLAVAVCCLPAILSLPPLVFTVREALTLRRATAQSHGDAGQ